MTHRARSERAAAALYRVLLHVYPGSFRADFARDMEDTFIDRYREARGSGARATIAFLLAAVADAVGNGLRERIVPHSYGYGMFHWTDVRFAFRQLRRSPLFSLLTIATLAGGLGLSIFTFSFLYTAMLKPLPLPGGDRIVRLAQATPGEGWQFDAVDVTQMRRSITTLTEVGVFTAAEVVIGDEKHRKVLRATLAEPVLFTTTRVRPMLGRTFTPEDQAIGAEPVIVLSHRAWELVFGADSSVVGKTTQLNGRFTRVIGVMPQGYGFPVASEAWMPLGTDVVATTTPGVNRVSLHARLAIGVDRERAQREMTQLLDRARRQHPPVDAKPLEPAAVEVLPFPMAQFGEEGPLFLGLLNLIATLILLLACINVTNLLLARANERARETAVRLALGASRGRLIVQSMWENVVICILGGALATAGAAWGLDAINHWMRANLSRNLAFWWVWHLDRSALVSACVFVAGTIAVLGAVVSARAANTEINLVLRDSSAGAGGRREGRIARTLVVVQVVAVTILMFFGAMAGVVAYRVEHLDLGYDTRRLLNSSLDPTPDRYKTRESRTAFYERGYSEVSASPAIEQVFVRANLASIDQAPASAQPGTVNPRAYVQAILGSQSILGVRMNAGRAFDDRDGGTGSPVAIVSAALARQTWPGESPIGKHIRVAADEDKLPFRTVVGVASDVMMGAPFDPHRSANAVYIPLRQIDVPYAGIVFRYRADVESAQSALYAAIANIDPRIAPPDVQTYDEMLEKSSLISRSVTKLFAACFGFALLLAISGTYGLMARSIGRRTREIGIRRALGATDSGVMGLLLQQGGRQLGVGVVIAMPVMAAVGFGFANFFPVGALVPVLSGVLVSAAIIAIVLMATWVPARRVLAVSPRDAIWRD